VRSADKKRNKINKKTLTLMRGTHFNDYQKLRQINDSIFLNPRDTSQDIRHASRNIRVDKVGTGTQERFLRISKNESQKQN
jgi:hypothetical protein